MSTSTPFVPVDPGFLRRIASGSEVTPSLYYHPNPILRRAFWSRLRAINGLMDAVGSGGAKAGGAERCLDFGGGGGVLLPTLAARFATVVCIDRDARDARAVVAEHRLTNARIDETDILAATYPERFDAIVAADVLEHFPQLAPPVEKIASWLAPEGLLFTSLPTESGLYALARRVFGVTPPPDHYHTAAQVEAFLEGRGFRRVKRTFRPLPVAEVLAMFSITAWRAPKTP